MVSRENFFAVSIPIVRAGAINWSVEFAERKKKKKKKKETFIYSKTAAKANIILEYRLLLNPKRFLKIPQDIDRFFVMAIFFFNILVQMDTPLKTDD